MKRSPLLNGIYNGETIIYSNSIEMVKAMRTFKKRYYKKYARVARPIKSYVRKVLDKRIEDKENTLPLPGIFASIASAWTEYSFMQLAQGVGINQRIGNRIRIKNIKVYGVITTGTNETALDDPYNVVRIVIAIYKGQSGVTPLGSIGANINSPIDKVTNTSVGSSLEWLLLDRYIPLQVTSTEKGSGDGYTPQVRVFKYFKKIPYKFQEVTFGDGGIAYPDRRIIMSCISDSSANPNPGFIAGYVKIKYEDS